MDQTRDILSILSAIPLFLDLSLDQQRKIADISLLVELDPGDIPIKEGASLDFVYIILEGEIAVETYAPTVGQVTTSKLSTHDFIGWSTMTPIVRQRTGTTTALTHCWLLGINGKLLRSLCEEDHDIGFLLYRRISNVIARSFLTTKLQLMNLLSK
jgi:CRP-like cAMP-binding protein